MARKKETQLTPAQLRAKKLSDSCRGAEATHKFLLEEGSALNLSLAGAAPLVFQGMCRKEGIKVLFTSIPKTDGRSIWLGPIDLSNPLASVYVFGHGVHERNHCVYTDFSAVREVCGDVPLRELTNIFEDIRIDRLGARDYNGYLIWRDALFKAYAATGQAEWKKTHSMSDANVFAKAILFHLEVNALGLKSLTDDACHLVTEARKRFGEQCFDSVLKLSEEAKNLRSTADAVILARRVFALVREHSEKAVQNFSKFGNLSGLFKSADSSDEQELSTGQGSLFGMDGEVTAEGEPKAIIPGYAEAKSRADAFSSLTESYLSWSGVSDTSSELRTLMVNDPNSSRDLTVQPNGSKAFTKESDFFVRDRLEAGKMREKFYKLWNSVSSFKQLFSNAMVHPMPQPVALGNYGQEIDDCALASLIAGNTAIFKKPSISRDREIAMSILLDTSGSMTDDQLTMAKVTALRMMEAFRTEKGFKSSMALFPGATSCGVTPVADWNSSIPDTVKRVDFVPGYGCTPIEQALFWAGSELMDRPETKKVIFVLTDGFFPKSEVEQILSQLKEMKINVAMIGIGPGSTPYGDLTAKVKFYSELPSVMSKLLSQLTRRLAF